MNPPWVYTDDPEGSYREGGGRGFQDGEHVVILALNPNAELEHGKREPPEGNLWSLGHPSPAEQYSEATFQASKEQETESCHF